MNNYCVTATQSEQEGPVHAARMREPRSKTYPSRRLQWVTMEITRESCDPSLALPPLPQDHQPWSAGYDRGRGRRVPLQPMLKETVEPVKETCAKDWSVCGL